MPVPPKAVQRAARRGLELREEFGRGGTATGIARARDLSNGDDIPRETLARMKAFFDRHQENKDTPPEDGNGQIAWLLWGGDPGRRWAESQLNQMEKAMDTLQVNDIVKVDESLGLVFGFAIVSKIDGEPYFDSQDDHIPDEAVLKAGTDFFANARVAKEMHRGDQIGEVIFGFPLTEDIAKSLSIESRVHGLLIAMKPNPEVLSKFKDGTYTGFSIGGARITDQEVD